MFVLQPKLTHNNFPTLHLFVMNFKAYLNATKLKNTKKREIVENKKIKL